ncbi:FKBP-type peptidyl-prolyl cis-trans isomerase [Geopsychrobacter electrodiphilus]|uniref:FKBP-type peptidyl-prolyl cis-trans isomerase n=1 Tax=Geopsychrobacter electrodiphilus TaxID=225196 RepID=UPI0003621AA3|nr:FKBP-type peptidyl-prolyl cis-trans isomerase [Geopsychrobacter electrodiphilus]
MKRLALLLLIIGLATPAFSAPLEDGQSKLSYAIGMSIGSDLLRQDLKLDLGQLTAGLTATYNKTDALLSEDEMVKVLVAFQKEMQEKQKAKAAVASESNKAAGKAFLAENAKKTGVKTTASGLQYEVLTAGKGATPTADDQVTVNYRGTLVDGTEFDSSYKRGQPATFRVGGVIPGWTEALQLMKEGGKLKLVIPPQLAYGDRGAPPVIGPGSTLVFEVELLKVVKK